jgi:hypothetical protein
MLAGRLGKVEIKGLRKRGAVLLQDKNPSVSELGSPRELRSDDKQANVFGRRPKPCEYCPRR